MAALQQQQQLQRQLLQQQMLLQQSTTASSQQADRVSRKQREIYVGNLAVGSVNMDMLRELFNAVLAQMVPDPVTTPPVVDVRVDTSGEDRRQEGGARALRVTPHMPNMHRMHWWLPSKDRRAAAVFLMFFGCKQAPVAPGAHTSGTRTCVTS